MRSSGSIQGVIQFSSVLFLLMLSPHIHAVDSDADGLSDAVETNTGIYVGTSDTGSDPNDPDTDKDTIPDGLDLPPDRSPVAVDWMESAGHRHTCALDDLGVDCWGANTYGETTVPALSNPVTVNIGHWHSCALDDSGVVCWGTISSMPLINPVAVSTGINYACALDDSGVVCWGYNLYGQTDVPLLNFDKDLDGLSDDAEDINGNGKVDPGETNTLRADSDGDGLDDGLEDSNGNGLIDAGETDPLNADSDGDGLSDGYEVNVAGSDPISSTPLCTNPGDMNNDNNVDAGDLILLQQQLLSQ